MKEIRALFRENPEYPRLLSEPSIPRKERIGLIDAAFGSQAEPYLVNFIKLLCEKIFSGNSADARKRFSADTLRRTTLPRQL